MKRNQLKKYLDRYNSIKKEFFQLTIQQLKSKVNNLY